MLKIQFNTWKSGYFSVLKGFNLIKTPHFAIVSLFSIWLPFSYEWELEDYFPFQEFFPKPSEKRWSQLFQTLLNTNNEQRVY